MSTRKLELASTVYSGFVNVEHWSVEGVDHPHEVVRTTDSVSGLLVDMTHERVLVIRMQHPAMVREDRPDGVLITLVAGRFDVNLSPKALLVKEALEEAGVVLREQDVEILNDGHPFALSSGVLSEMAYLCYAEISPDRVLGSDDEERGAEGEGEAITRVWVSFDELDQMVLEDARLIMAVQHLRLHLTQRRLYAIAAGIKL